MHKENLKKVKFRRHTSKYSAHKNVRHWRTLLLEVAIHEVGKLRMLTHKLFNSSEDSEGEVFNSDFNLILGSLDNQSENLAFDVGIVNGGVRFIEVQFARCEAVGSFGRGLEILSAFGLPSVAEAGCLVVIIVHDVLAG